MSASKFDLEAEWREACSEFVRATGMKLKNVVSPTAEQITAKFDEHLQAEDAKSQTNVGKAKRAVGDALRTVQTIGNLLAQGAEMTGFGGPANITMNCISFFINVGFAYKGIAEGIESLFSRICPLMARIELYIKDRAFLGPEMELITHKTMIAVVRICQHCIGILQPVNSKRAKAGRIFKLAFFNDDSGVQQQSNILETLQVEEQRMAAAVSLTTAKKTAVDVKIVGVEVKNVAAGVGSISDMLSTKNAATAEEKIKEEFMARLGVEGSDMKSLQSQYRNRREKLRPGTCAWLKEESQYKAWSDPHEASHSIMILSGGEGSGKSYAMTSVIQDLEKRYPQGRDDSTRISVAYFYFTRSAQSDQKKDDKKGAKAPPSIKEMLRTWACQIMHNDTFYRKNVHKILKDDPDFGEVDGFLQRLFLDQLPKGSTFFLLLDESNEIDEDGHSELLALLKSLSKTEADLSSLRVMVTAKPSLQRDLETCAVSTTVTIKLEDQNKSDIQDYVESKANSLACFKTDSTDIQQLKSLVVAELPAAVNGNFLLAERKLQEINSCQDQDDVRQIVNRIKTEGADLSESIEKEVSACNKVLSTKQVRIVNALLLWVIYAAWDLQVYELESILFVQEQHTVFQPLAKELREQYAAFFNLSETEVEKYATVSIKSSAHAEYFKDATKQKHSPDSSSNQTLSKGQIQVVRHFVEKLCEQELYDKLGLADFFDQKLAKSDVNISVDCDNAQARISLGCLQALAGDLGEKSDSLRQYARNNLASHLKQVDLDIVEPLIKAEMGPLLVKSFTDEKVIQSSNTYDWCSWAYNDAGLSEVVRLFKSSAVTKNVVRGDKSREAWINKILGSERPELELLKAQTSAMARAWVDAERVWDISSVLSWWYGYYNKIESKDDPSERMKEPPPGYDKISLDMVIQIYEQEVAPLLTSADISESRKVRSLGITLLCTSKVPEAIERLTDALALDPDDLVAHDLLADAYSTELKSQSIMPNWDEALRHKDIVIERLKAGKKLYADEEIDASRKSAVSAKATWLRDLKKYEDSQTLLQDLLREDPGNDTFRLELMRTLCQCQKFGEIVEMLEALENEVDKTTNNKAISRFLQHNAFNETCRAVLVSTFREESQFEGIKRYYRAAIKDCASSKDEIKEWRGYYLVDGLASVLFKFGTKPSEREEAITLWETLVKDCKGSGFRFVRQLCKAYIQQAVNEGPGSSVADAMIDRVKKFLPSIDEATEETDYSQAEVRSLLARYYRSVQDRTKAQQTLRPDMELALKLLHDEDSENDWQGFQKLGDALMDFGATVEALAAWSLIQPTQGISRLVKKDPSSDGPSAEDRSAENQADKLSSTPNDDADAPPHSLEGVAASTESPKLKRTNTTMIPTGPLSYWCDCRCGTHWTYVDDFYTCLECIGVRFSKDCLDKFQAGEVDRDICDPEHKFLHVPAWTVASFERAREGKVLVGDSEKEVKAWLKEIGTAWELSDVCVEPAATTPVEK